MADLEHAMTCRCSLDQPALAQRLDAWRRVAAQGRTVDVTAGRVVAAYPRSEALLQDLQGLVTAEAECCSFLTFTVEERGDEIVSELTYPADMPAPLRDFIAELTARRQPSLGQVPR